MRLIKSECLIEFHVFPFNWFWFIGISKYLFYKIKKINQNEKPHRIYLKYLYNNKFKQIYSCRNVLKPNYFLCISYYVNCEVIIWTFEILYMIVFWLWYHFFSEMFILFVNSNKIFNFRLDTIEFFVWRRNGYKFIPFGSNCHNILYMRKDMPYYF